MPPQHTEKESKRKPHTWKPPVNRKPRTQNVKTPRTSAKTTTKQRHENLTGFDWLQVFSFVDANPTLPQAKVVEYFKTRPQGALLFTQATLSRQLATRNNLQERIENEPGALSSKRCRIVTHPDVDRALYLWVKHMEEKGESVNGAMLKMKRACFEDLLDVPEVERLVGDGWIPCFCKAWGIREFRRHGEAGSVDKSAMEVERLRVQIILAKYTPKDRFNFDETALFPYAPPDRGLATRQMSGKKSDKFRITLGLACNADGSEKLPPIYIGKSAKPRCFKGKTPQQLGFDYHNNAKAWMTAEIFTKWIKKVDIEMGMQGHNIILLLDNFSGHYISYQPHNIHIEFFQPNLTSFVQPCDAGIIRCFKAHYRKAFCLRTVQMDEAGDRDIYKISLLEAMLLVKEAWNAVSKETIMHCWNHTKIQAMNGQTPAATPLEDQKAWDIIYEFARSDWTLLETETRLQEHLGSRYKESDWRAAFKAVMDAENDVQKALEGLDQLTRKLATKSIFLQLSDLATPPDELQNVENSLKNTVDELKRRNRIIGTPLTLKEMLNPPLEKEIGDTDFRFEGGDAEIIQCVKSDLSGNSSNNDDVSDDDDDEDANDKKTVRVEDLMHKVTSKSVHVRH